ncbi:MAG: metallophosphoesterase [Clostridiales bacterium]|nr:metallophosphoesterase [Clostridiales bacterium]
MPQFFGIADHFSNLLHGGKCRFLTAPRQRTGRIARGRIKSIPRQKSGLTTVTTEPKKTGKKKHRVLLRILVVLLVLAIIAGAFCFASALYSKTHYKIHFYQETSKKVSDNIRIAVISDIHNREYGEKNEKLLSDLRDLKPDLIFFMGDMIIKENYDYQAVLDLVSASSGIAPCYGVLGNHESYH